jgi:hypothetical protein
MRKILFAFFISAHTLRNRFQLISLSVCMPEKAGRPSAAAPRRRGLQQAAPRAGEAVGRRHPTAGRQNRRELGRRRANKGG